LIKIHEGRGNDIGDETIILQVQELSEEYRLMTDPEIKETKGNGNYMGIKENKVKVKPIKNLPKLKIKSNYN
jgi:hypothetical protein